LTVPSGQILMLCVRDPLEQLQRSHRRLEEACAALITAAAERDIETASDVCAFFARQVRRHEADEEATLFPRLRDAGANGDLREILDRLSRQHRDHEGLQERLESAVSGRFDGDLWQELTAVAALLAEAYRSHLDEEESHVFPAARTLLTSEALDAMSQEMDARRGR
jgi:hemerythrin-like domain-containing protein